jgi:hypothetical protein
MILKGQKRYTTIQVDEPTFKRLKEIRRRHGRKSESWGEFLGRMLDGAQRKALGRAKR